MATHKRASRIKLTAAITAVAAAAGVTVLSTSFAGAATPAQGTIYGANAEGAVAGSYIVLLDKKADKQDLAKEYGGKLQRNYSSAINGFSASGLSETEAKRLAADPAVDKVVQNKKFSINATQDNPPSWGLDRIDQAALPLDDSYTWQESAGRGVTVYVIDTGIRISHKDFGGRASYGWDFVGDDRWAGDGNGHGTHVAATIAGTALGVAKKARVVSVRVLDNAGGGTTAQVIAGIDWVTRNARKPAVANVSLGGYRNAQLDAAVRYSIASGVTYTVAAGNEGEPAAFHSPAAVKEAITVGATGQTDDRADFSNWGSSLDLFAPGVSITSASYASDTGRVAYSGTSMAAPHAAGAAALYLADRPKSSPAQVAKALTTLATSGKVSDKGTGSPNKLLRTPLS
jgi:subtilisin family serine protease